MFKKVKGVADNFFDMAYLSGTIKKIEAHLKRYNFTQIDLPILEHVSLFERGLGYETDVVSKQMFVMQSKGSEQDPVCLRPEATAGTMRAFLEEQSRVALPCKVFCYGPMFRYERPQKGRLREFHQMNLEVLGGASILYDAAMIKMLQLLFTDVLHVPDFVLKLNFLGQLEDRKQYCRELVSFLKPQSTSFCSVCQVRIDTNPLRVLDCNSVECQKLLENAPKLSDFFSQETSAEWLSFQEMLQELSVNFVIDHRLVRGLDYYNKTVFEFVSVNLGAQNTFCGGGRYDGLAQQLGSKQAVPALGCAIGMERLLLILEGQKNRLSEQQLPLACIIPLAPEQHKLAVHLFDFLTAQGTCAELLLDDTKMKNAMKRANDLKAQWVLILGEDEQKNNTVTLKNMVTGAQEVVLQKDVYKHM